MNDEWLENELRRLPAPELPTAWREEIMAAARQASRPGRTASPPWLLLWQNVFRRHPFSAGALAVLWITIFVLKAATPIDPMDKQMLAHINPQHPPDFVSMNQQIRLAELWTSGRDLEPDERQRP